MWGPKQWFDEFFSETSAIGLKMFEDILGQTVDHNWCPFQPGLDKGRSKFGTCRGGHDISRDFVGFFESRFTTFLKTETKWATSKIHHAELTPRKLTWQWKIHHLKMYFLLEKVDFHCYCWWKKSCTGAGHIWYYGMTSTPAPPVQCCVLKPCAPVQDFGHSTSLVLWQIFLTNVKCGARGSRLQVFLLVQDFFHQPYVSLPEGNLGVKINELPKRRRRAGSQGSEKFGPAFSPPLMFWVGFNGWNCSFAISGKLWTIWGLVKSYCSIRKN